MGSWKLKIKAEIKLKSWKIHLRKIPEELGKKDRQKIGKKKKKTKQENLRSNLGSPTFK